MIQLELYLKEISNFLRTLTVKNTFFADHMFETWVKDEYKEIVKNNPKLHPYYRNITGDYILFDYKDLEHAYGIYEDRFDSKEEYIEKQAEIIKLAEEVYGLSRVSMIPSSNGSDDTLYSVPNSSIYNYCNELPIINSFDTQNKIPFTKAILTSSDEINTAEIYKIPNERYFKLIEKYPTSADIIKSIVYPIKETVIDGVTLSPFDRAYQASNFELLAWSEDQLEENEFQSMYECTVKTLDMINKRYAVSEYCFEDLYPQALTTLMWDVLYMELFSQRIANIRTGNVHSYHLWSYLKSNGMGEYRDILSQRQQNFLYRNLRYLIEHKGTQHAMEILIYVLLTSQNISLEGKNTIQMKDNSLLTAEPTSIIDTAKKSPAIQSITVGKPMLTAISNMFKENPDLRFQKVLEYMGQHAGDNSENDQQEYEAGYTETTDTIYNKEYKAGIEYQNDFLFEKSKENCDNLISTSPEEYRNTKLLELTNNSSSDLYVALYTKFFAETLMYRLSLGDMKFSVSIIPPGSATQVVLSAKDAVGFIFYALNKVNANTLPDKYAHVYEATGQAYDYFKGDPEFPWSKGRRVYKTWYQYDKPPTRFQIEWPYKTVFDGVVGDFPALPDKFAWKQRDYLTSGYLNSIVIQYTATIDGTSYAFDLESSSVEATNRRWICSSKRWYIEYYSSKAMWVIRDKNSKIMYYSNRLENFTLDLTKLTWYEGDDEEVKLNLTVTDKTYVIDQTMHNYSGVFHNVTDFSGKIHNQCMDFIQMYLENARSESAVLNALYTTICKERYAKELVTVNLMDGKTFTEYLESDDENIVALKEIFKEYDSSSQSELNYSKFAECLVAALMPKDEALLSSNAATMNDKYKKIIKLFKSMIPYNLAFIESTYKDTNSSVMGNFDSDAYSKSYKFETTEITDYSDDCRTKLWETFVPTYMGQTDVVRWDIADVALEEQCEILNKLDDILDILDSTYTAKTKKSKLNKLISNSNIVTYLLSQPVSTFSNLQSIQKRIVRQDIVETSISDNCSCDTMDQYSLVTWNRDELRAKTSETEQDLIKKQCVILDRINYVAEILNTYSSTASREKELKKELSYRAESRLTDFNTAVASEKWSEARAISESWAIYPEKNTDPMTETQISAFRDKMNFNITRGEELTTYVLNNADRMLKLYSVNSVLEKYNSPMAYISKDIIAFGGREPTEQELNEFDVINKGK